VQNAITVDMAIGGSTNCIIHVLAMRTCGPKIEITFDDFDGGLSRQNTRHRQHPARWQKVSHGRFFSTQGAIASFDE
jgi:hypothetical protein